MQRFGEELLSVCLDQVTKLLSDDMYFVRREGARLPTVLYRKWTKPQASRQMMMLQSMMASAGILTAAAAAAADDTFVTTDAAAVVVLLSSEQRCSAMHSSDRMLQKHTLPCILKLDSKTGSAAM